MPFVAGYARRTLYGAAGGSLLGLNDRSLVLRRVYVVRGRAVYRLDLDAWTAACAACAARVAAASPWSRRLLHAVAGDPHEKRALHAGLARHRVRVGFSGEWYRPVPAVLECLDVLLPRIRVAGAAPRRGEAFYPAANLLRGLHPAGLPTRRVCFTPA